MKSFVFLVAGMTAAIAYILINQSKTAPQRIAAPVDDLAHKLQDAWVDHHTVA